jgi:ligand-binding sensor domain-containing protein
MPFLSRHSAIASLVLSLWCLPLMGQAPFFQSLEHPTSFQPRLLFQEENGFVWAGGEEGLYRFDGLEWEAFPLPDSLQNQALSSIQQGNGNHIWVGFSNGWILQIESGLPPQPLTWERVAETAINQVIEGKENQLWIATAGEGVLYRPSQVQTWTVPQNLPDEYIYSILLDDEEGLWVATDRGVGILNPQNLELIRLLNRESGLQDEIVRNLAQTDSGIWMGTYEGGIGFFHQGTQQIRSYPKWTGGPITSLLPSRSGLWIGTERQGIWHREPDGFLHRITGEGRSRISQLMLDQEGNLWSCGQPKGLQLAVPALLHLSVPGRSILSLHCGKENVWFATPEGLFAFTPDKQIEALVLPAMGRISCLYEDELDYLWIGTQDKGAWRVHPPSNQWEHFSQSDGLVSNHILSINGDQQKIWFATFGGAASCALASELDAQSFRHYNQEDGLGVNYIYQAYIDSRSRVWFATDGKGLRVLEGGKIRPIDRLQEATILDIAEDEGGKIWFHSSDSGLYSWDKEKISPVSVANTLPVNVNGIISDGAGRILLAGPDGLEIFSPHGGTHWHYGPEDGVAPIGPNLHLVSRDSKGQIWIGTQDGLICYQPQMLPLNSRPHAELKGVSVLLEEIRTRGQTRFAHDENHLTFHYAGIWFQKPEAISFQHRLIGLDLDWVISQNRQVIYPRLDPGKYTFEIRSSANQHFAQAPLARYQFEIRAPFWVKWWFVGPMGLLVFLLFVFWLRMREDSLRRTERLEKNYLAAQFETLKNQVNPHFLFNSFNTLTAIIEDQPKEAVAYVEHLSDLFRNILDFREESIISLERELRLLDKFYYLQKHRYGENFLLEVKVPDSIRSRGIPPLSLQMLVENALKHNIVSRKQPLTVTIEPGEKGYLKITNNLQFRRDHQLSTQLGQQNIRQRYQLLGEQEVRIAITATHYTVLVPLLPSPEL